MKLMTKRLLAVVMTLALTLGMAISAMALSPFPDSLLEEAGLDPDKAVIIVGPVDLSEGDEGSESRSVGSAYAEQNEDGTWFVDLSQGMNLSGYTNIIMIHGIDGGYEWESAPSGTADFDHLSPFWLVGEKKGSSSDSDSGSSDSSSSSSSKSSSSKSKSPKTGMDNTWMLWLMAAGVFAGSSVIAYNRKKG